MLSGIFATVGAIVVGCVHKVATAVVGVVHNVATMGSNNVILSATSDVGTSGLDMTLVEVLLDLCESVMRLFTIFPLNIFLIAGLVFVAFKIIRSAKKSAK